MSKRKKRKPPQPSGGSGIFQWKDPDADVSYIEPALRWMYEDPDMSLIEPALRWVDELTGGAPKDEGVPW